MMVEDLKASLVGNGIAESAGTGTKPVLEAVRPGVTFSENLIVGFAPKSAWSRNGRNFDVAGEDTHKNAHGQRLLVLKATMAAGHILPLGEDGSPVTHVERI